MPSTRALKTRIRSVKNTKQITRAMQMVAASKMHKAQEAEKATHDYTMAADEILSHLASQGETDRHPLFQKREVRNRLLIVIASDKGLAGAFNSNIIKAYINEVRSDRDQGIGTRSITIGRRVSQFVARLKDVTIDGTFDDLPDNLEGSEFHAILKTASELFRDQVVDAVDVIFTEYISSFIQTPKVQRILPAGFKPSVVSESIRTAEFEPSAEEVLDGVAYRLVGSQIYQAMLDSRASEHSMRMVAMKNATDNATDLIDDLTLEMNKARQGAITQELSEISAGVEAMK